MIHAGSLCINTLSATSLYHLLVAGRMVKKIKSTLKIDKMKISVKVKDIEIEVNDSNSDTYVKYDTHTDLIIKIIKSMSEEATKLLKERNA